MDSGADPGVPCLLVCTLVVRSKVRFPFPQYYTSCLAGLARALPSKVVSPRDLLHLVYPNSKDYCGDNENSRNARRNDQTVR